QVPNPGDYYAVSIGRQPMVMIRQPDMGVQVLYNRCPHRGVQVVGNLKGNTDCGMKRAARVDSYRGFVFASLVDEGPSLAEFLGEAKIAFDDMCDRSPLGEVE